MVEDYPLAPPPVPGILAVGLLSAVSCQPLPFSYPDCTLTRLILCERDQEIMPFPYSAMGKSCLKSVEMPFAGGKPDVLQGRETRAIH